MGFRLHDAVDYGAGVWRGLTAMSENPADTARSVVLSYALRLEHGEQLQIPAGAKALSVAWHDGGIRLYVLADPEVPKVFRRVRVISTGNEMRGDGWDFAGTVVRGRKIWHVFLGPG